MPFTGKSVIITGAGKGIGRATAILLAERGARVVAISRTQSDLDSLPAAQAIVADLSDPAAARAAMAQAGTCDFLVNCAGTNVLESLLDMS
ncbi:MAG: SDR family NAD(P)-dependent oxidoreductase, partial [Cereibacter changlensis]